MPTTLRGSGRLLRKSAGRRWEGGIEAVRADWWVRAVCCQVGRVPVPVGRGGSKWEDMSWCGDGCVLGDVCE